MTWPEGPGVVELPDGRRVRGRGLRNPMPDGPEPDLGIYLLGREPPAVAWEHRWVRWHDFRTPADTGEAIAALALAHRRAADGRVEIACGGGIGRTGAAVAVLAVMSGIPPQEAVDWARTAYHRRAVETPWQRRWVRRVEAEIRQA